MPQLGDRSTVCALVPHYESHHSLGAAIESLLDQTRPPDAVVVVDDASAVSPLEVVSRYPGVTLLAASDNVGPYRLIQTVIERTSFDAYLFQDADDFSHPLRLRRLLEHAAASGADMVGSFEVRVDAATAEARPVEYPVDVNAALRENPIAFGLLHPTSLVSRSLVVGAGGYPGGLRFGGDVDFLWRAAHLGRVVNVAEYLYFRRVGPGSLSGSDRTGLRSSARKRLDARLRGVARENASAVTGGARPARRPFAPAPPVELRRLAGPDPASLRRAPAAPAPARARKRSIEAPVVVIGAPRTGTELVMWGLDQHPAFRAVPDGRWLGQLAGALGFGGESATAGGTDALGGVRHAVRRALGGPPRLVFAGPQLTAAALEILALHPDARFIHVARDPDAAVASLRASPVASGDFYAGEAAMAACGKLNAVGGLLEAALPSGSVLRLEFDALVAHPVETMRRCLDFLGEAWVSACARPVAIDGEASSLSAPVTGSPPPPVVPAPPDLAAQLRLWRRRPVPGAEPLPDRLRGLVGRAVPPDAVVSVVSRGDPELLAMDTEQARHFPEAADGGYAGEYPATSQDAVELLESARRRGATHFVVPAPGLWWLTFYAGLAAHLEHRYEAVAFEQGTGIVFSLGPETEPDAAPATRAAVGAARRPGLDDSRPEGIAS